MQLLYAQAYHSMFHPQCGTGLLCSTLRPDRTECQAGASRKHGIYTHTNNHGIGYIPSQLAIWPAPVINSPRHNKCAYSWTDFAIGTKRTMGWQTSLPPLHNHCKATPHLQRKATFSFHPNWYPLSPPLSLSLESPFTSCDLTMKDIAKGLELCSTHPLQ